MRLSCAKGRVPKSLVPFPFPGSLASVDGAPVPHFKHQDQQLTIVDPAQHPVITDAIAPFS